MGITAGPLFKPAEIKEIFFPVKKKDQKAGAAAAEETAGDPDDERGSSDRKSVV